MAFLAPVLLGRWKNQPHRRARREAQYEAYLAEKRERMAGAQARVAAEKLRKQLEREAKRAMDAAIKAEVKAFFENGPGREAVRRAVEEAMRRH